MPASTTPTPITTHDDTILMAFELSARNWVIGVRQPESAKIARHIVRAGDRAAVCKLVTAARVGSGRALGQEARVVSCYEAGRDGFWLDRWLGAIGVENLVFEPASIAVDRRARRAKTDRIDVEALLRTLAAYRRGEPLVVRIVRVPTPAQEDARRRERWRERLIKERTGHRNRIKALLATLGLAAGQPRRPDWPTWLERQRDWQGAPVPPELMAELTAEHARLMLVDEQIAAVEARRVRAPAPELAAPAARLMRLKGIGPTLAAVLAGEVFWKDFKNRREVAAYVGLAPSPWQSGAIARDQGISKAGNKRARTAAIELAWLWLYHQPQSPLSRWFQERVGLARGRVRRIAIVALARKLMVALWRFLTTGLVPANAIVKP